MELKEYQAQYESYLAESLKEKISSREPKNLYEPIEYIMQMGGKRLRPVLTLIGCDVFGGELKNAMPAAMAVEMFHNFTLIHDDIMDNADLRRGKETVHKKWDNNTAILSGDALMILAYQFFEEYEGEVFKGIISLFNETAIKVCEGQQWDMDFEKRQDVSLPEYQKMIGYKTGVLVASALKMGAIVAGANTEQVNLIYEFGLNLGIAFQLQDDYLDTFGEDNFGKKIGGDILEAKKTFLVLKTFELASDHDSTVLKNALSEGFSDQERLDSAQKLFRKYQVDELLQKEINNFTQKAFENLKDIETEQDKKLLLENFAMYLMNRKV